jgi:hypothetical protein
MVKNYLQSNGIKVNDCFYEKYNYDLKKRTLAYFGTADYKNIIAAFDLFQQNKQYKNINPINSCHLFCLYFEDGNGFPGMLFSLQKNYMSLDEELFNQSRHKVIIEELTDYCRNNNIGKIEELDEISMSLICFADFQLMSETSGIDLEEIEYIFTYNTHKQYVKYYIDLSRKPPQWAARNHIEAFCRYYHSVIKIISGLIPNSFSITVHDVGTNVAQFPLLLSGLSREQLLGININRIIASDNKWIPNKTINQIIAKNPHYRKIDFINLDIQKQMESIPEVDVTIAIDVFEHLKNDSVGFKSLAALWRRTKKVLIMHVPFETELSRGWGHNIIFNSEKLRMWQMALPHAQLISDEYCNNEYSTLLEQGYLVLYKKM